MILSKQISWSILGMLIFGFFTLMAVNSMKINNDAFMLSDNGIKFTKRLDEMKGEVVVGRAAASSSEWETLAKLVQEPTIADDSAENAKKSFQAAVNKLNIKSEQIHKAVAKAAPKKLPAPAVKGDLELKLSSVFIGKPLGNGQFSGSATVVDGIIEEIYVNLPDGQSIEINTRDRMVGNVFNYEDTETRELRSGMFYEIKKGKYMITLTNDSKYAGARLQFESQNGEEVRYADDYYEKQESWGMDQQNEEVAQNDYQPYENTAPQDEYHQDREQEDPEYRETDEPEYGFNFNT